MKEPKAWITVNGRHIPIFDEDYVDNEFEGLGKVDSKYTTKKGAKQIQSEVNPNYREDDYNCGKCALAFVLREMGYDVEALNGRNGGAFLDAFDFTAQTWVTNVIMANDAFKKLTGRVSGSVGSSRGLGNTVDSVTNGLISSMKDFGDGSVAILNVFHQNGLSGHAINMINKEGKVIVVDAQNGVIIKTKKALKEYLSNKMVEKTSLFRVDNVKLYDDWQERCKDSVRFKKESKNNGKG